MTVSGPRGEYDALLLVSFGGPEGPDDVVPFLENVTRGRGIPRERLVEVGAHYSHFGGVSPINEQNRALLDALRTDLAGAGLDLPVYWGNRNWAPYLEDAIREMRADGVRRALCLVTSAYASYSGCRQYRENLADAVAAVEADGLGAAPELDKLRHYFDHPGFVAPMVDAVLNSVAELGVAQPRLVFTTHSIPTANAEASGPSAARTSRSTAPSRDSSPPRSRAAPSSTRRGTSSTSRALAHRRSRGSSPTSPTTSPCWPSAGAPAWCSCRSGS